MQLAIVRSLAGTGRPFRCRDSSATLWSSSARERSPVNSPPAG